MDGEQILGLAEIICGIFLFIYGFYLVYWVNNAESIERPIIRMTDYLKFYSAPLFPIKKYTFLRLRYVSIYIIVIGFVLIILGIQIIKE